MSDANIRMSDEDFMKNYDRHNIGEKRSDKYKKDGGGKSFKIGWWIFLVVAFIAAYYFFSEVYFTPIN